MLEWEVFVEMMKKDPITGQREMVKLPPLAKIRKSVMISLRL